MQERKTSVLQNRMPKWHPALATRVNRSWGTQASTALRTLLSLSPGTGIRWTLRRKSLKRTSWAVERVRKLIRVDEDHLQLRPFWSVLQIGPIQKPLHRIFCTGRSISSLRLKDELRCRATVSLTSRNARFQ